MKKNQYFNENLYLINRINWFCKNKVNAFSPTISPAPKSIERNEIESLYEALKFYIDRGVNDLVIQKKYMGSYCDIYLNKSLNESYLVSRNGFKINHIDLEQAFESLIPLHQSMNWDNTEMYIIQSELMPWSVLGKGLIENDYLSYLKVHSEHSQYLNDSPLYKKITETLNSELYKQYLDDSLNKSKSEFLELYPKHIIRQYEALRKFVIKDLKMYNQAISVFKKQIEHFGKDEKIYFKPFNVLKVIYTDGTERVLNDNHSYSMVNSDPYLSYHFNGIDDLNSKFEEINQWVTQLNESNEEGVVVKPAKAFIAKLPPGFKVRNNQYLTMIYGMDFHENYNYYFERRKISKKIECSINDWMINYELINIKYSSINEENYLMKNLVFDRIQHEKIENQLDTRL